MKGGEATKGIITRKDRKDQTKPSQKEKQNLDTKRITYSIKQKNNNKFIHQVYTPKRRQEYTTKRQEYSSLSLSDPQSRVN